MKKVARVFLRYFLPLVIIFGAVNLARFMIANAPKPEQVETENLGTLVSVESAVERQHRVSVTAQGQVRPARMVQLQAQVSGLVEWIHPDLVEGGQLSEGEEILRIEQDDYDHQISQARASYRSAQAMVDLEEGRQEIAERELDLFRDAMPDSEVQTNRALREPQQRDAEARVSGARAALNQARLALERTVVSAPFNAYVLSETVEPGQLVGPGGPIAQLVGTDAFWVQVSVPVDRVERIGIPGVNTEVGSSVTITQTGREGASWPGRVLRLLPNLDPAGRMARVLVEVDDPLGLRGEGSGDSDGLPLFADSFVHVEIEGRSVIPAIEIPREWLHEGHRVYVMTDERTLDIREVTLAWRRADSVLVSSGLRDGDQIVTNPLGVPVQGMLLRTLADGEPEGSGEAEAMAAQPNDESTQ